VPKMDDYWPDFPVILGFGSMHDLADAPEVRRSRLWDLRSPSKAACMAYDAQREPKARKVGFMARNHPQGD
jgi:hypothetical protein